MPGPAPPASELGELAAAFDDLERRLGRFITSGASVAGGGVGRATSPGATPLRVAAAARAAKIGELARLLLADAGGGMVIDPTSTPTTSTGIHPELLGSAGGASFPAGGAARRLAISSCTITSVQPNSGDPAGGETIQVMFSGGVLASASGITITVGGKACSGVALVGGGQALGCVTPDGVGANLQVTVHSGGVPISVPSSARSNIFSYYPATPSGLRQSSGVVGSTVRVLGRYFVSGSTMRCNFKVGAELSSAVLAVMTGVGELSCAVPWNVLGAGGSSDSSTTTVEVSNDSGMRWSYGFSLFSGIHYAQGGAKPTGHPGAKPITTATLIGVIPDDIRQITGAAGSLKSTFQNAVDAVNADKSLFPGLTLQARFVNSTGLTAEGGGGSAAGVAALIGSVKTLAMAAQGTKAGVVGGAGVVGIVGGYHSFLSAALHEQVARALQIPQISYGSHSAVLASSTGYPYFIRTSWSVDRQAEVLVRVAAQYGWSRVGILSTSDDGGGGITSANANADLRPDGLEDASTSANTTGTASAAVSSGTTYGAVAVTAARATAALLGVRVVAAATFAAGDKAVPTSSLGALAAADVNVVLLLTTNEATSRVALASLKGAGFLGAGKVVIGDAHVPLAEWSSAPAPADTVQGVLVVRPSTSTGSGGVSTSRYGTLVGGVAGEKAPSVYHGYVADSVRLFSEALHSLLYVRGVRGDQATAVGSLLQQELRQTSIMGATGLISCTTKGSNDRSAVPYSIQVANVGAGTKAATAEVVGYVAGDNAVTITKTGFAWPGGQTAPIPLDRASKAMPAKAFVHMFLQESKSGRPELKEAFKVAITHVNGDPVHLPFTTLEVCSVSVNLHELVYQANIHEIHVCDHTNVLPPNGRSVSRPSLALPALSRPPVLPSPQSPKSTTSQRATPPHSGPPSTLPLPVRRWSRPRALTLRSNRPSYS